MKITDPKLFEFTHLLFEQKGKYFYENEDIRNTHDILDTINCFSNIGVEYRSVFPIKIKTRPCIILLRRKNNAVPSQLSPLNAVVENIQSIDVPEDLIESLANELDATSFDDIDEVNDSKFFDEILETSDIDEAIDIDEATDIDGVVDIDDAADMDDADDIDDAADANDIEEPLDLDGNLKTVNEDEQNNIVEMDLKKPTIETKQKLRKLIERHYRSKVQPTERNDPISNKPSTKSNIKQIIQKEKIKELIEKITQIDLRTVCDLEKESTKNCLLKIIDSYME